MARMNPGGRYIVLFSLQPPGGVGRAVAGLVGMWRGDGGGKMEGTDVDGIGSLLRGVTGSKERGTKL